MFASTLNCKLLCVTLFAWVVTACMEESEKHTVGAQSIAQAQSIAHGHIGNKIFKKTKFLKNYSYKDIKGSIQQQIIEQKNAFSALKVENSHIPKKLFLFFVKILPGDFFWHLRIFADFKTGF